MEPNEAIKVAVLETEFKNLSSKIDDMKKGQEKLQLTVEGLSTKIDDAYFTKKDHETFYNNEFVPLQTAYDKLIWWIIGTLLAALGGLILAIINFFTTRHA